MNVSRCFRIMIVAAVVGLAARATVSASPTNLLVNARTTTPASAPESKVVGLVVSPPFIAPVLEESTFVMPKGNAEGRDPFFPKSSRPYIGDAPVIKSLPVKPTVDLALKGISGSKEQPLAIINTTTFESGEENDVVTKAGKMRIRCIEINMDAGTVLIQVGGERRELRLNAK